MAYTLSPNLRLRLDTNLTANSKYNLLLLDSLAALGTIDTDGNSIYRGRGNLQFTAEDASVGGSGTGGTVTFGLPGQPLSSFNVYATTLNFGPGVVPIVNGGTGQTTAPLAFGALSPLTTKGDLLGFSTSNVRVPVGSPGQFLTADPTQADGLSWAAAPITGITSLFGDVTASGTGAVLATIAPGVIVDSMVAVGAAIEGTKVSPNFGSQNIQTLGSLSLGANGFLTTIQGASSVQSANWTLTLPPNPGVAGYVLSTDGLGATHWTASSGGSGGAAAATWTTASGTSFTFAHGLGTDDIQVSVYDITTETDIEIASKVRPDTNHVTLTASSAPPAGGWRVVVFASGGAPLGVSFVGLTVPSIFSLTGSPITSSGTFDIALIAEPANTVFAGPTSGASAVPTFRPLVAADLPAVYLPISGGTLTGPLILSGDAVSSLQPVTLEQLNSAIFGLGTESPVNAATTSNIVLSGEQTIDGILTSNSRVLVKNQTLPAQNGIWVSSPGAWTRSADMDDWADVPGKVISVDAGGTVNGGTLWLTTAAQSGTIGVTPITFTVLYGPGSVNLASPIVTGVLPIPNGGTGQTSATSAFAALSPLTTLGDLIYEGAGPAPARLPIGTTAEVLTVVGGVPTWQLPATGGTVTSVSVVTANGVSGSVATPTTTPAITLTLGAITPTSVAASGTVTGSNLSGTNTGDQTITLTGAVTGSGTGTFATTLTAVNLASQVTGILPTANGGTGQSSSATFPTSGTVSTSTSVETLTNKSISGSTNTLTNISLTTAVTGTLPVSNGGTGQTSAASAFAALSPLTTAGDLLYENATPTDARLPIGTTGQLLTVVAGLPAWSSPATSGTVTSVAVSGGSTGLTTSGGPITSSGTITLAGTLAIANGGTGQTSAASAYNALSPMTTTGDIEYESGTNTASRLAIGTTGQVLTVAGGIPSWAASTGFSYLASSTSTYGGTNSILSFTGADNLVIGVGAGAALTTSHDSVFEGYNAGNAATTANFATVVGSQAVGTGVMTGADNTAIGYQAGKVLTSGTDNTALGYQAGSTITTGTNNVILGSGATNGATASNNTVVGYQSTAANTAGNTLVGASITSSGVGATAVGFSAGANSTGSAFGYQSSAGGTQSVSLGYLSSSASGNSIAIGVSASASAANAISIGQSSSNSVANTMQLGASTLTAVKTFGSFNTAVTQTTVSGSTSGSVVFGQPSQGASHKKVLAYCSSLVGTASYTFPTAFTQTPTIMTTNGPASSVVTALSASAVTITGASTTGFIFLEGY